jgi:hypothetical protein
LYCVAALADANSFLPVLLLLIYDQLSGQQIKNQNRSCPHVVSYVLAEEAIYETSINLEI